MWGGAAVTGGMRVDLAALGKPRRAASAGSCTSRRSQCSSAYSPCSAKLGARRALERKRALPRPPRPPGAATNRSPCWARSARSSPSRACTSVPSGTGTTRSVPRVPCRPLPDPRGADGQRASTMPTSWRPLRRPNRTTPSAVANSVSSPPRPTLSPGWKRVPRWRTMMVPARTLVPAPTLTPRRCAAESRPLREEAAPFFFDMVDPCSAGGDLGDLDQRVTLAVTPAATLVGLRLVGEPADLLPAAFLDDAGHDPGGAELVGGGEDPVTVAEEP